MQRRRAGYATADSSRWELRIGGCWAEFRDDVGRNCGGRAREVCRRVWLMARTPRVQRRCLMCGAQRGGVGRVLRGRREQCDSRGSPDYGRGIGERGGLSWVVWRACIRDSRPARPDGPGSMAVALERVCWVECRRREALPVPGRRAGLTWRAAIDDGQMRTLRSGLCRNARIKIFRSYLQPKRRRWCAQPAIAQAEGRRSK